ncbi:MAG: copper-containing nitrite reductase, partial [Bacteroidia bacterium]
MIIPEAFTCKKLHNQLTFFFLAILVVLSSCKQDEKKSDKISGYHTAELTDAPFVPKRGSWDKPQKVIVNLEILEVEREIMDGTTFTFWTFGGQVPGKFIRVNLGDDIE